MEKVTISQAIEMLVEISKVSDIHPDTEFSKLGLDSLQEIEWISMVEDRVGIQFNVQDMNFSVFAGGSVSDVLAELHKQPVTWTKS